MCTNCPGLCLEAAGMAILRGVGSELKCNWRDVTGLFLDVAEGRKNFIKNLKALTSQPGTESEKMHGKNTVAAAAARPWAVSWHGWHSQWAGLSGAIGEG